MSGLIHLITLEIFWTLCGQEENPSYSGHGALLGVNFERNKEDMVLNFSMSVIRS